MLFLLACFTIPDVVKEVNDDAILRCGQHILLIDQTDYKTDDDLRWSLEQALYIRSIECPIDQSKIGPRIDAVDMALLQLEGPIDLEEKEFEYLESLQNLESLDTTNLNISECSQPVWGY